MNIPARLYLESDCDNPSDYAWVSVIAEDDYCKLITDYPEYKQVLNQYSEVNDGHILVYYQKMKNKTGMKFPDEMMNFLSLREPYDGKVLADEFCRLHLCRFSHFVEKVKDRKEINIFEGSFLQNQVNELLGHQKVSRSFIIEYLTLLMKRLEGLNPILIYLSQLDVHETILRVANERRSPDKSLYPDWIDQGIKIRCFESVGEFADSY